MTSLTSTDDLTPTTPQRVLVVGATGGTGSAVVGRLRVAGHSVTAFARSAERLRRTFPDIEVAAGDATSASDVDRAVAGHDAVIITVGIAENPIRVRLLGPSRTPIDVRSTGTRNVVRAMRRHGVQRLVVQSSYGVGESRDLLRLTDRLFFRLVLAPQIRDTELQERIVRSSALDWVLVQPVHLTDDVDDPEPFVSTNGDTGGMKVTRASVARLLARAAVEDRFVGETVAVSAPLAAA
jgi:uncharacterized protein YbjT (DUF2867 family)